jgi:hypothetical protein
MAIAAPVLWPTSPGAALVTTLVRAVGSPTASSGNTSWTLYDVSSFTLQMLNAPSTAGTSSSMLWR